MLQSTTNDDAGKPVPLVRFNIALFPWPVGPLPRDVQIEMRSALMAENWKPRSFASLEYWVRGSLIGFIPPVIFFSAVALLQFTNIFAAYRARTFLILPILFPIVFVLIFKAAPFTLTRNVRKICAAVAVRRGYCASCGHPLPDTQPAQAPLTICTECGAAWARPEPEPDPSARPLSFDRASLRSLK